MIRILASILLGGGMIGAFAGWALIQWLEGRRKAGLARLEALKTRSVADLPRSAPGAVWPVPPRPPPRSIQPSDQEQRDALMRLLHEYKQWSEQQKREKGDF